MRARRGRGHGGLPLDLIGQLIGPSLIRPRREVEQIGTDATCVENVKLFVEGMQFI